MSPSLYKTYLLPWFRRRTLINVSQSAIWDRDRSAWTTFLGGLFIILWDSSVFLGRNYYSYSAICGQEILVQMKLRFPAVFYCALPGLSWKNIVVWVLNTFSRLKFCFTRCSELVLGSSHAGIDCRHRALFFVHIPWLLAKWKSF